MLILLLSSWLSRLRLMFRQLLLSVRRWSAALSPFPVWLRAWWKQMKNVKRNKRTACVDCSDFYEQLLQTLLPAVAADFKIVRADIDDIPVYLAVDSAADMVLSLQYFAPMDGLQIDLQIDAQNMITGWEVVLSD